MLARERVLPYYFRMAVFCILQSLNPPVLVFVQSKERAKELYKELAFDDIKADVIHADLTQDQVVLYAV